MRLPTLPPRRREATGLPPPVDRARLVLARKPVAGEVPRERGREEAVAQCVGLPGDVGMIQARSNEDGLRVRHLVSRELALLELRRREHPRTVQLRAKGAVVPVGRRSVDVEADELVPPMQGCTLAGDDPV